MAKLTLNTVLSGRWIKRPNPVLLPGKPGEWDDAAAVTPSIWKDSDNSYSMYYMGQGRYNNSWGIGLATSSDLINWTKSSTGPILESGGNKWGECIDGPCIQIFGSTFYLFYETAGNIHWSKSKTVKHLIPYRLRGIMGRLWRFYTSIINQSQAVAHAAHRYIGLATSEDRLNWKKHLDNPVLISGKSGNWDSCGIFSPAVYKVGDIFYMFYSSSDGRKVNSGLACSTDLSKWVKNPDNPILKHGEKGAWDERSAVIVSMTRLKDFYLAFYEGEDSKNRYRVGIVYSKDLKRWIKFEGNPILEVGDRGTFDETMVCSPHVIKQNGTLYLFYGAHSATMTGSCGMATFCF